MASVRTASISTSPILEKSPIDFFSAGVAVVIQVSVGLGISLGIGKKAIQSKGFELTDEKIPDGRSTIEEGFIQVEDDCADHGPDCCFKGEAVETKLIIRSGMQEKGKLSFGRILFTGHCAIRKAQASGQFFLLKCFEPSWGSAFPGGGAKDIWRSEAFSRRASRTDYFVEKARLGGEDNDYEDDNEDDIEEEGFGFLLMRHDKREHGWVVPRFWLFVIGSGGWSYKDLETWKILETMPKATRATRRKAMTMAPVVMAVVMKRRRPSRSRRNCRLIS